MSAPFKMTPGRGPYQKTGQGIPDTFKSPTLQKQSYEEKLAQSMADLKSKDANTAAKYKKKRQENVLDSLSTVVKEGRDVAAAKYGDKSRGKGLPTDASESTYTTKRHVEKSKGPKQTTSTYQEKLQASLNAIKNKDATNAAKWKKKRQDNVIDSLNTVVKEGRDAAAEKYGNKSRGGALPTDASESTFTTKRHVEKSKKK